MQDRFDLKHDSDITATQLEQVLGNASCRRVWELGLSALRDGDQKWSSCEKTLAGFAVRAGWPDQGIAILLTAFRRRHGLDLKLRENHYATVISVARKAVVVEGVQADLDQALFDTPENQAEVLKSSLAILFGVDITHMIKYLGDPSVYYMMTKQGNVTIGGIDRIYSQTRFREAVGDATAVVLPKVSGKAWDQRVQAILWASEDVDVGDASHPKRAMRRLVEDYLLEYRPCEEEDRQERNTTLGLKRPFVKGGRTFMFVEHFRLWLQKNHDDFRDNHQIGRIFSNIGMEPKQASVRTLAGRSTRSVWTVPEECLPKLIRDGY